MNLIIMHKNGDFSTESDENLTRFAMSSEPVATTILDGLSMSLCCGRSSLSGIASVRTLEKLGLGKVVFAIPEEWGVESRTSTPRIITYSKNAPICLETLYENKKKRIKDSWFVISNGRFAIQIDNNLLEKVLVGIQADVVAVNVEPKLLAYHENVRLATQGKVAGFQRLYTDSAEPAHMPAGWPHHIFIRTNVLEKILPDHFLCLSFSAFLEKCQSNALVIRTINVAGIALDLETEDGLLGFCKIKLSKIQNSRLKLQGSNTVSQGSRFIGRVLLGKNIHIDNEVVVIGPTIISNNVKIKKGAVINSSIIGPEVCVPRNQFVQNCIVREPRGNCKHLIRAESDNSKYNSYTNFYLNLQRHASDTFCFWPRFSYAGCFKKIADCFAAIIVLTLFAPLVPFIALAIKLNSPGPVFFKDKRQGLYGRVFKCLKFRTMLVGADEIQDKLRIISHVDGPQFKIKDDPRISRVGRFLRYTYIDEIPQFINVLFGQMSVIGPRPSPESENVLCPSWREARLSVRPGITGLWQVCGTRQPMKDFQEWIYYDTKYVRNLSLRMDLWICWQTTKKICKSFADLF